ncbi:hypothetical protein K2P97_02845 [bacterium]|nr:hypothetical protein [bacterium]
MHKLFVTQVYQTAIKCDLKDLKKEVFQIQKADKAGQKWSELNYKNGYTSYGSWDQLHQMSSTFEGLEKKINSHVQKFCKSLEYDLKKGSLKMNSFWVNIMPSGAIHTAHIHPHSVISGTYYVDIPTKASAIKFEDPRLGFFMNAPLVKENGSRENVRFFSIEPKSGDLILFESWLKHEVPLNQSKKPRISISFNYTWA